MTFQRVDVALGARSYPVLIGAGALRELPGVLDLLGAGARLPLVTDRHVAAHHLDRVATAAHPRRIAPIIVPPGEGAKSFSQLEQLCEQLLAMEPTRDDLILAFGGGVIGDLAGFAAAILKRGLRFVQLPTTLLAMVDSSVGGKTAINSAAGKNLLGAFHQPSAVVADLDLLATLPAREMAAGYAEVLKYALIGDPDFFAWLKRHGPAVLALETEALSHAVATSVRAKARVVAADERETAGLRALLNLGHTFGHALEAETGFSDRLLHGEAVGIGMALAFGFSARLGLCAEADAVAVAHHLASLGLKSALADAGIPRSAAARLVAHMAHDKKRTHAGLPFILAHGIGQQRQADAIHERRPKELEIIQQEGERKGGHRGLGDPILCQPGGERGCDHRKGSAR